MKSAFTIAVLYWQPLSGKQGGGRNYLTNLIREQQIGVVGSTCPILSTNHKQDRQKSTSSRFLCLYCMWFVETWCIQSSPSVSLMLLSFPWCTFSLVHKPCWYLWFHRCSCTTKHAAFVDICTHVWLHHPCLICQRRGHATLLRLGMHSV